MTFLATGQVCDVPPGTVLQDLAREIGVPLEFGCRRGTCGTCIVAVEGELPKPTRLEQETLLILGAQPPKHRLACRLAIYSDLEIAPAKLD